MNKNIRPIIALITFGILFIVLFPISVFTESFDFATSVVPGWHTRIYPPFFIWGIVKILILMIVVFCYWRLHRIGHRINKIWFFVHLALTLPSVIDTIFPISPQIIIYDAANLFESMEKAQRVVLTINLMFLVGQVLFLIYFIKAKAKATANSGLAQ